VISDFLCKLTMYTMEKRRKKTNENCLTWVHVAKGLLSLNMIGITGKPSCWVITRDDVITIVVRFDSRFISWLFLKWLRSTCDLSPKFAWVISPISIDCLSLPRMADFWRTRNFANTSDIDCGEASYTEMRSFRRIEESGEITCECQCR